MKHADLRYSRSSAMALLFHVFYKPIL